MMNFMPTIQVKRANLATTIQATGLKDGEFAYAKDTNKLYIGTNGTPQGNVIINPDGGTASEAAKLSVARAFSISGDGTAPGVNFDGTAAVNLVLTLANSGVSAGTYAKVMVDAKGRVTQGFNLEVNDLPEIPVSKIAGLGTAATANTGTANGNVPVIGESGTLEASIIPDLSSKYIAANLKGQANGVAELGADGKIPSGQLPAGVDDVVDSYVRSEGTALQANWLSETKEGEPLTPASNIIYVIVSEGEYQNKTYRWSGSTYVEISASLALGETSSTAFRGDYGAQIYNSTINGKNVRDNPTLTYTDVGADQNGAAAAVLGSPEDQMTQNTVYGAQAHAAHAEDLAQSAAESADAKVASVTAGDGSVTIAGTGTAPTVAVKISATKGNSLSLQADGLFAQGKNYTAGNGIDISGNAISAKVVSGNGLSLTGNGITMAVATEGVAGAVKADNTSVINTAGTLSVGNIDCGLISE